MKEVARTAPITDDADERVSAAGCLPTARWTPDHGHCDPMGMAPCRATRAVYRRAVEARRTWAGYRRAWGGGNDARCWCRAVRPMECPHAPGSIAFLGGSFRLRVRSRVGECEQLAHRDEPIRLRRQFRDQQAHGFHRPRPITKAVMEHQDAAVANHFPRLRHNMLDPR